jgi:hypothetical protein
MMEQIKRSRANRLAKVGGFVDKEREILISRHNQPPRRKTLREHPL